MDYPEDRALLARKAEKAALDNAKKSAGKEAEDELANDENDVIFNLPKYLYWTQPGTYQTHIDCIKTLSASTIDIS